MQDKYLNNLVYEDHTPKPALVEALTLTNITHDNTLKDIVAKIQFTQDRGGWLRPISKERWETDEIIADKRDLLLPIFDHLGILQEVTPSRNYYDYALLLGATVDPVRARLQYLATLWKSGIRFGSIIILTGQRTLNPKLESPERLLDKENGLLPFKEGWHFTSRIPTTETEMIQLVLEQSELPKEWDDLPIIIIDTPMQQTADDTWQRPNTHDTVKTWLHTNPTPGNILAISNQPYVGYQNAVLQNLIPNTFVIETVGKSASPNIKITTALDTLARWLQQMYAFISSSP